jgi:RHS repeat-associated protein
LGIAQTDRQMIAMTFNSGEVYSQEQGVRSYELTNHLGNVLLTITDKGVITSAQDYYPFGLTLASRSFTEGGSSYRFSFNGKENDKELKQQDYGMRIYRPDLGKFLSVDPLADKYPFLTPYQFASNTPIQAVDLDGAEARFFITNLMPGNQVVNLVTPATNVTISQLDAIGSQINNALSKVMGKYKTALFIPADQFTSAANENFNQYFANYDYFGEPWGTCVNGCDDPKHTEIDNLAGKGQVIVQLDMGDENANEIKLPKKSMTLSVSAVDGHVVDDKEITAKAINLAASIEADINANGKLSADQKVKIIADIKLSLEATIKAQVEAKFKSSNEKTTAVNNNSNTQSTIKVNIDLPSKLIVKSIQLKVFLETAANNKTDGSRTVTPLGTIPLGTSAQVRDDE